MSRWADDPDRAADDLISRTLPALDLGGRILLAGQSDALAQAIGERGLEVTPWNRRLRGQAGAAPWPPAGPFDAALLRLPRAKAEQEMAAHACLSVLDSGGRLVVQGGNDEGIRSFADVLAALCGDVTTLATRGHGRVLAAGRPDDLRRVSGSLAAWRRMAPLDIAGLTRDWVTYPGMFAAERVDEGTALLIGALPALSTAARVLDYGCGSGVIGAAVAARHPAVALDLLDNDAVALEAARENLPEARVILADALGHVGAVRYDAILSNPPLHSGAREDHTLLQQLIADAPRHLKPAGVLQIVVQRRVPLDRLLAKRFAEVTLAAENGRYRVWRAQGSMAAPAQGLRTGGSG
jgi:16S rRNA (guanine1207-N2)-methyltransferase